MDALSYTQLGESSISSKLPEIAMRQYKIAEANREKTEKQHTDLISLFKYDVEGFNPDRTGLEEGYQAIIKEGSNIALKQGYTAAQQYVQTQKSLLDNISKMSTAQAEKYKILTKDFSDSKKWGQATEESRYKTGENLKKYTMANEYEPTKQDYDAVRKKYGYSSSIPDKTLRPLVRQGLFGEGENILDFKSEIKLFSPEDIAPYQSTSVIESGSASIGKDKAGNTVMNKYDSKREDKEKTLAGITNYLINPITKEGYTYGQVPIKQMYEKGMLSPKAKEYYEKGDINTAGKITASELPDNVKSGFFKGSTGSKQDQQYIKENGGFNFNFGTGYGENDKYAFSSAITLTPDITGTKERKVGVMNITKKNANDPDIKMQAPRNTLMYDESKKQWVRHQGSGEFVISDPHLEVSEGGVSGKFFNGVPTEDVTRFGKGVYLKATALIAEPEYVDPTATDKNKPSNIKGFKNVKKEVMIPIDGNMNAVSTKFGIPENKFKEMLNTTIDMHNQENQGSGFTIQRYNIGGGSQSVHTQQKTSNLVKEYKPR